MVNQNRVQCEKCNTILNLKKIPIESKYIGEIRI